MNCKKMLQELVYAAEKFRATPIVDDDFCLFRDRFDFLLRDIATKQHAPMPTIVCLCGSTRFSEAFREANLRETLAGKIVLSVGCDTKSDDNLVLNEDVKEKLDELHLRKIDLADEVLILNVGGYIGESTSRELAYAVKNGKVIRMFEPGDWRDDIRQS